MLVTSVSWQAETEARQLLEMLCSSHLAIQEKELRVQELSLRLEEKMSILLSLKINSMKAMRLLTMCLREPMTATSD
jgi:hypothetical protein